MSSPIVANSDMISATVLVGGQKITDTYPVRQIQVQHRINRVPWAKIVLTDGDPSQQDFAISESEQFVPGNEVEIKAGYRNQETSIFKGIVVRHSVQARGGSSSLTVMCFDKAVKMTIQRKSNYFLKMSNSAIIEKVIGAAGLSSDVGDSGSTIEEMIQYYATDWDFLVSRAEACGQVVIVADGKVTVMAPDFSTDSGLEVKYGSSIVEVEAEIDARNQLSSVTSKSWDFAGQAVQTGSSSEPTVNSQGNLGGPQLAQTLSSGAYELMTGAPVTTGDLTSWAKAQLLKSRMARIRGKVTFPGSALAKPGTTAKLEGLGARFDGTTYFSGVTHRIEPGNWTTEAEIGLSPRWFAEENAGVEALPAGGLLPAIHGVQIGTVKKIQEDPDGQTRIQVDVPMIAASGDGVWARIASPYATKNAGVFFMPEVGDEVVLSFLNNDPSFPIIIGSLYCSQHTQPFTPDEKNTHKAIVSNAQLKIDMDDVKKIIQITTPGGHCVTMSDDQQSISIVDSNKNKLEMSSSGITIDSPGNITVKATGQIQIKAQTSVAVEATTDLSMKGLNVSAEAQVAAAVKGQAQAELSASGQTTVRGAMVMIN
ncbi:MAG: type VI secretion system tip protein VgrG [Terracidiphilus sp.]